MRVTTDINKCMYVCVQYIYIYTLYKHYQINCNIMQYIYVYIYIHICIYIYTAYVNIYNIISIHSIDLVECSFLRGLIVVDMSRVCLTPMISSPLASKLHSDLCTCRRRRQSHRFLTGSDGGNRSSTAKLRRVLSLERAVGVPGSKTQTGNLR